LGPRNYSQLRHDDLEFGSSMDADSRYLVRYSCSLEGGCCSVRADSRCLEVDGGFPEADSRCLQADSRCLQADSWHPDLDSRSFGQGNSGKARAWME